MTSVQAENLPPQVVTRLAKEVRKLATSPPEGIKFLATEEVREGGGGGCDGVWWRDVHGQREIGFNEFVEILLDTQTLTPEVVTFSPPSLHSSSLHRRLLGRCTQKLKVPSERLMRDISLN